MGPVLSASTWALTALALLANWEVGSKRHSGWLLVLLTQVAAAVYDAATHQWGFVVGAGIGGFIAIRNYMLWHPDLPALSDVVRDVDPRSGKKR